MNEIKSLQEWYKSQCDGDWENQRGIAISSCDNPGWWVRIDLVGTQLESIPFAPVIRNVSLEQMERIAAGIEHDDCDRGTDWLLCEVKNKVFSGAGDPDKLLTILGIFLDWANDENRR